MQTLDDDQAVSGRSELGGATLAGAAHSLPGRTLSWVRPLFFTRGRRRLSWQGGRRFSLWRWKQV